MDLTAKGALYSPTCSEVCEETVCWLWGWMEGVALEVACMGLREGGVKKCGVGAQHHQQPSADLSILGTACSPCGDWCGGFGAG